MFESWFADPTKVGVTIVLMGVIWAIITGKLVTAGHISDLKASHGEYIKLSDKRIADLEKDRSDYKEMLRDALAVGRRGLETKGVPETA